MFKKFKATGDDIKAGTHNYWGEDVSVNMVLQRFEDNLDVLQKAVNDLNGKINKLEFVKPTDHETLQKELNDVKNHVKSVENVVKQIKIPDLTPYATKNETDEKIQLITNSLSEFVMKNQLPNFDNFATIEHNKSLLSITKDMSNRIDQLQKNQSILIKNFGIFAERLAKLESKKSKIAELQQENLDDDLESGPPTEQPQKDNPSEKVFEIKQNDEKDEGWEKV